MSRRTRVLVALAVIALVSPLILTAAALHVLLDHDHENAGEPHAPDSDSVLHGHAHPNETPRHEHGLSSPAVGTSVLRDEGAIAFTPACSVAPLAIAKCAFDPHVSCEALARASPTAGLSSVLRI